MGRRPPGWKSAIPALATVVGLLAVVRLAVAGHFGAVFLVGMLTIVALMVSTGFAIMGRLDGILINSRNLVSLSRFQAALWTVVLLPGWIAMVAAGIMNEAADPLAVEIPGSLLAIIGVSGLSLVGTRAAINSKAKRAPGAGEAARAVKDLADGTKTEEITENRRGTAFANPSISDARFTDMFEGDEVGNAAHVDLSKVQMFVFTLVAVLAYVVAVQAAIAAGELSSLPMVSEGLAAILGISHAGYLATKALDHSNSRPESEQEPEAEEEEEPLREVRGGAYAPEGD